MAQHRLDPSLENVHWGFFDAKLPPRLEVHSGDTVVVDTVSGWPDVAPGEARYSPVHREIFTRLKPTLGPHILTGPVAVRGAEPGDTLEVPSAQRRPPAAPLDHFLGLKLPRNQAMAMAYASGRYSMAAIARAFDVHYATVSRAVGRKEGASANGAAEPQRV